MADAQVAPAQSFEERMKAHIRDGIGDKMTDEELAKIVRAGVDDVFFKSREEKTGSWQNPIITKPGLIHEIVRELLADSVKKHAAAYIAEHQAEVLAAVQESLTRDAGTAILRAISYRFQNEMMSLTNAITSRSRSRG